MNRPHGPSAGHAPRRDFNSDLRLLRIAALAAPLGVAGAISAWALLHLIRLCTNLFFFQSFSDRAVSPAANALGAGVILVPALGGLLIGLMARYGSEKIRGHGIPEAIEAILFGQSRMAPRVAVLKPLSSAIAIGSGGPFGAEGPIIMTGCSGRRSAASPSTWADGYSRARSVWATTSSATCSRNAWSAKPCWR